MKIQLKLAKRLLVSLLGFPILLIGLILIPLPGPGVLVSALGLLVLSTEFDWARMGLEKAKQRIRSIAERAKQK